MSQSHVAYGLACVLSAPAAIATALAEPAVSALSTPLAPSFEPEVPYAKPSYADEFARALTAMSAAHDLGPADAAHLVAEDAASREAIVATLSPAERIELDDRIVQLRIEDRVARAFESDSHGTFTTP